MALRRKVAEVIASFGQHDLTGLSDYPVNQRQVHARDPIQVPLQIEMRLVLPPSPFLCAPLTSWLSLALKGPQVFLYLLVALPDLVLQVVVELKRLLQYTDAPKSNTPL